MLKVKKLMCLLSFLLLFYFYNISTITPFHALATEVVEDNSMEMVHKDKLELIKTPIEVLNEKFEQKKLEMEMQEQKKQQMETDEKKNEHELKEFILTFYTSLESENSSAGAVTCQNKPLSPGGVANNVIPQNTKLYLEGYGLVIVNDRGSDKYFGVDNRLDVFIERESGESDRHYSHRVNSYGVQKVQGYIISGT